MGHVHNTTEVCMGAMTAGKFIHMMDIIDELRPQHSYLIAVPAIKEDYNGGHFVWYEVVWVPAHAYVRSYTHPHERTG